MEDLELFKSFVFKLISHNPGRHTDNSSGINNHYIGYMYRGSARIVSENEAIELQEGDLFYIPKNCKYHSYWFGEEKVIFDSFAFSAIPQQGYTTYCLQKLQLTDKVKMLHQELAKDRTVNARSVAALYALLWELVPTMKQHTSCRRQIIARQIADYIYEHPDEASQQVAKNCGVSESTMYHLLKLKLGKTPNQLRQEAKCQKAVVLLTSTDLSVEQISRQLGFSSSSYMRKLLHATTGKTPLQIRKEAQSI